MVLTGKIHNSVTFKRNMSHLKYQGNRFSDTDTLTLYPYIWEKLHVIFLLGNEGVMPSI